MAPSISIREYIRWLPEDKSEPTTTIVLTSPEHRFVDIRILKPEHGRPASTAQEDVLHSSRLDWAFAGTSSSELKTTPDGNMIAHSIWRHWVSSRDINADGVVDEGDMAPQSDGKTIETGSMVNPATGRMTDYEECWLDPEPIVTDEGKDTARKCTVLLLHDDANQARGMVVRLGQYCQGVLRVGEYFSLERWEWEKEGGWKRKVRIGDLWIPCGVVLDAERVRLGGEVKHGEYWWKVVEMGEF